MKSNSILNIKKINDYNGIKCDELFKIFNEDLSKKPFMKMQMKQTDEIKILIKKIFLFGVKYYNFFDKLNLLIKTIEKMKLKDMEDIKKNIIQIHSLDNYSLLYNFYEESFKIKDIYQKHKSKFNDEYFDEENKKYFKETSEKIEFLYQNLIPIDDLTKKPNTLIIKNIIESIDNSEIGVNEIIQYSMIQNISTEIKIIELSIINNLLLYLNKEGNIFFLILNFISKKMRHSYNIISSIFDHIYGVDYYKLEILKYQFHSFLNILSYKTNNEQNKYSILANISLTESLIWKIKRRNFPILLEIMKVFEEIIIKKSNNDNIFHFNGNNIYNVEYFNENKKIEIKFEIFKKLVYQIFNIIKDFLKNKEEKEVLLSLEKNSSIIFEKDIEKILGIIMSFFIEINQECILYDEIILFFYKILINSFYLLDYILKTVPNVLHKILKIAIDDEYSINKNKKTNSQLIMIKLLCQVVDNINEDNLEDLSRNINYTETGNYIYQDSLIYLCEKLIKILTKENQNL